jgi:hypothetical protein
LDEEESNISIYDDKIDQDARVRLVWYSFMLVMASRI